MAPGCNGEGFVAGQLGMAQFGLQFAMALGEFCKGAFSLFSGQSFCSQSVFIDSMAGASTWTAGGAAAVITQTHNFDGDFALLDEAVAAGVATATIVHLPVWTVADRGRCPCAIGAQPKRLAHAGFTLGLVGRILIGGLR